MDLFAEDATFLKNVEKLAKAKPERAAYIFMDKDLNQRIITRQDIWDKARKFAAVLRRRGLGKGDIVCNTLVNSPERLLTYFGTLASGAIPSHGQLFLASGEDLIHNLQESKCKAIIYDPKDKNGACRILENIRFYDKTSATTKYKNLPNLTHVIGIAAKGLKESERWIHAIDKEEEMFVDESISKDDTAVVLVTSGTTGFSKLVPHSHSMFLNIIARYKELLDLCEETVFFNMQSMGWIAGVPRYYTALGCTRVLVDLTNGFPVNMTIGSYLVNIFNKTNVNSCMLMTPDIQHILDALEDGFLIKKQIGALVTGGGPIHNATVEAIGKITHEVFISYGGTEFPFVAGNAVTRKSDFLEMCVGYPVVKELKIVGTDNEIVAVGKQGEILVHSSRVFNGYLNNPSKTAEAFTKDGWYKTGDIGYFNNEGKLFVMCRKADVITKDGFCHYPGWMELLVTKHPQIQKCVVLGIPDPVHNEEICLCMKLMPDAKVSTEEMREYCKKLYLTHEDDKMTPLPRYYLIFDEIILNVNGKIDRKKMREEALKRLNCKKSQ